MFATLTLEDPQALEDLRVFLERSDRFGDGVVRLLADGRVLAAYVCTQAPAGILDPKATVLGMRAFGLAPADPAGVGGADAAASPVNTCDVVVQTRALLDRIARINPAIPELPLPDVPATAPWAGVSPPRAGWASDGTLDAGSLSTVAEQGIARVADALPDSPGEALVTQVRAAVWGQEVAPGLPAAAAFAAHTLGFLRGSSEVRRFTSGHWTRLSTPQGSVLFRGYTAPAAG